jgi:glycosyltransferase involved in cell wall biosynthesis
MDFPARALFVNPDLMVHNGVPRTLLTLARHRDATRLETRLATLTAPPDEMASGFAETGTPIHELPNSYPRAIAGVRSLVRDHSIDVVVGCSFKAYLIARFAALGTAARPVFWIHGIPLIVNGRMRETIFRFMARDDTLIFISEAVRQAHSFPSHRGREAVVYNGAEHCPLTLNASERAELRRSYGLPADAAAVGYTATFIGWKRHINLLHAFASLATAYPSLHLVLIGTGELRESLQSTAESLGVAKRVCFTGPVGNASQLLEMLDVYAHPAVGEGFGLAIAEAALAGLPIVAADAGAIPEIITNGETGLLFAPENPDDLATKLRQLLDHPDYAERLASSARSEMVRRFSPRRYAEGITEVIEAEARLARATSSGTRGTQAHSEALVSTEHARSREAPNSRERG